MQRQEQITVLLSFHLYSIQNMLLFIVLYYLCCCVSLSHSFFGANLFLLSGYSLFTKAKLKTDGN